MQEQDPDAAVPLIARLQRRVSRIDHVPSFIGAIFIIALIVLPSGGLSPVLRHIKEKPDQPILIKPSEADVLLISGDASLRFAVARAVRARGHQIQMADSAPSAIGALRNRSRQVGWIVIDPRLGLPKETVDATALACPQARIIVLEDPSPETVAPALVSAGLN